ncbi:ATP-binding protein [Archangium sp.]|uniref:sensor histidine kinase n=1 Tax=Archangium sp. TaxID=1872627 RepID=UPI00389AA116
MDLTSSSPHLPGLPERLRQKQARILRDWERRVLDEVHPEGGRPVLEQVLPSFLERLAAVLAADAPSLAAPPTSSEGTRAPRGLEPELAGRELRILRQVLFSVLEEEGPVPGPVRDRLLDAVDAEVQTWLQQARVARQEAQQRLLELHALFRQSPAYVTIYRGPEHFIEFTSALSLQLFGRDTRGKPAREAMPEFSAQGILKILDNVYATGEPFYSWELRARVDKQNDGHLVERCFNTRTHATRDVHGKIDGIISHTVDVTEQVLLRTRLEESVRRLEHEREQREQFVSMLSHDLRNPLSAAGTAAQMLLRSPQDAERVTSLARRMLRGLERADQMLQDLLDASRLQSGKMPPLELSECELASFLARILEDLSLVHGNRFVLEAKEPVRGFWNASGLRRVIENLAGNAIKYGDPQSPVRLTLERKGERVALSVHNRGEPISTEAVGMLFQPYHRAETAWRSGQKGWGIGLAVVRSLVEAHGGHVQATSAAGLGTTFIVELPVDARPVPRAPELPPASS